MRERVCVKTKGMFRWIEKNGMEKNGMEIFELK